MIAAESERTTALVTIAQANAQCLIQTGTMGAEKALTLANRFLDAKQVSQKQRRTVNNSPGFEDLMKRYINEQRGCEAFVKDLDSNRQGMSLRFAHLRFAKCPAATG